MQIWNMGKLALASLALVAGCEAKVEVTAAGGGDSVKLGTFTCAEVKDDTCIDPTDTFPVDVPMIHMVHQTKEMPKNGDVYSMQWIAEDIGEAAAPNSVVTTLQQEVTDVVPATASYFVSTRLSKPTAGWPPGKYRVEVKLGDSAVTTARFSVK